MATDSKHRPYFDASHKPQKPNDKFPPTYSYRVKLKHLDGKIERLVIAAASDERMLVQAKELADIFKARIIKIWGRRPFTTGKSK